MIEKEKERRRVWDSEGKRVRRRVRRGREGR